MTSTSENTDHNFRSKALTELFGRGFGNQCTNLTGLDEKLNSEVVPVYIGFDATADSLHVGHLVPIMCLRHLQRSGHKPIVLMGGGTTRIGDPSFRSDARPMLSDEQIDENIRGIRKVFERFLKFGDGPTDAVMLNNADWLNDLRYIDMLREIGVHFSVNRMLSFDSVKSRLERQDNMSFLEFNYMILQGYDFLELFRRAKCGLQMGGSDQWGNIINGIELVRRIERSEVFGLTMPLLTTASGAKMGKTAAGAVWVNEERLSPYEYWQFWRNTDDADVGKFLRLFTDLPLDEIAKLEQAKDAALNEVKKLLANEATTMAHGQEAAEAAAETARQAFEEGGSAEGLPEIHLSRDEVEADLAVVDLLVRAGMTKSRNEGARLIANGGIRINDEPVVSRDDVVAAVDLREGQTKKLSIGKKKHILVKMM
ncbi:tyrosine--tRNA ligase [Microvirga sp. W0021]|uniref:Tyrosine--tRNA ligase n=1 Tax=Hohaiivirga grylli TaxID=3133970 RepID=A0ABV0BL00_9HYPH